MHVRAKPTIEQKTVICPFCNKGKIDVTYTSEHMSVHSSHAAGRRSQIPNYHLERYEVHTKCPDCGKSKKHIKEVLQEGGSKPKSHEERLKRLQAAGLPTKIVSKRE